MAKKAKTLPQLALWLKLICKEPSMVGLEYGKYGAEDATIIGMNSDQTLIKLRFDINGKKYHETIEIGKDIELSDFWEAFSVCREQSFCYDPENVWIASDGDGDYYGYDSEEAARDYAEKNDEEETVGSVGRSKLEQAAPEMYVCLNRVLEHLRACQLGEISMSELGKKLMAIYPRINSAIADAEKEKHLKDIIKLLDIGNIA